MKKILVSILCLVMLIGVVPTAVNAAATIDTADITVTHPAHLANPDVALQVYGNCRIDTSYNSKGHTNGVRWKDVSSGVYLDENDTFIGGKKYELSVYLISKTGYSFSASTSSVTVNMDSATLNVKDVSHAYATITLTADNLYINYVTITGLDSPKVGNKTDFSVSVEEKTCEVYSANSSPTSGMFWRDDSTEKYLNANDKYQSGHKYTVGIYIKAKSGYEFPNNVQVTINGKACKIGSNNGNMIQALLEFPALDKQHKHTPSTWRTTGIYHYKVCTTCGDFLEQEDHKGGVATCTQKGKCTVCGYAYIEENEKHTPDKSKWTACGDLYHAHLCKDCGAHAIIEDHKPGPAATEDEPQKCKVCGYIIVPAKNHKHKLTKIAKVEATCTKPGNVEYYACDSCSDLFADGNAKTKITDIVIAPIGHKVSDDWNYDKNNHWRICSLCKEVLLETQMAHEVADGKCTTCGYDGTAVKTEPETDSTPDSVNTENSANPVKNSDKNLLWLWIAIAVVVIAGGGFAVYWFVIKKNRNK